jgi:peptidyl-prolyl cis-trans isomerase SurA
MKKSIYTLLMLFAVVNLLSTQQLSAQNQGLTDSEMDMPPITQVNVNNEWIFKINSTGSKKPIIVSQGEFERQFLKNLNLKEKPVTEKDIDEYLRLYIRFKMKIQDAIESGKDTLEEYKQELAMYRDQLAKNYLYDRNVTQQLIEEAYERMKSEVKVSHILMACPRNASQAQVDKVLKRMNEIHAALMRNPSKDNFASLAASDSEDPGTKNSGGNLGYLTALQVVYEFENEVYNTPVGGISKVFRTDFGFHVLRVEDKRPNPGDIKLRHILIRTGSNSNHSVEEGEKMIREIFEKIKSGQETFESMARLHSEDYSSKYNGGIVDWVNTTQFIGDLERQMWVGKAFELKQDGDYTEVFKTNYGWHILQRVGVRSLNTFDQMKPTLKTKVQQNQRSQISVDALVERIKMEDGFKINSIDGLNVYNSVKFPIVSLMMKDSSIFQGTVNYDQLPEDITLGKRKFNLRDLVLVQLGGEDHSVDEFISHLVANKKVVNTTADQYVDDQFNDWVSNVCVSYQNEHLEEKSVEFKDIYQEYREGILMFNRMQEKVWNKANLDTVGLEKYYQQHVSEYQWDSRFHVEFYFSVDEKMSKKVFKQVKKGISPEEIKKEHTQKALLDFNYRIGKYQLSDTALFPQRQALIRVFSNEKMKKSKGKTFNLGKIGDDWVVVKVIDFLPEGPKTLEETRGPVASKYQEELEKLWIQELESKYSVESNSKAIQSVKGKLITR